MFAQRECVLVNAVNAGGSYANERRWEIKNPRGTILASGKGGDTVTFCLSSGLHMVIGWDTWGDGWNGGALKVIGVDDGTIYLPPWNGPTNKDKKLSVTTSFSGPCGAGTYVNGTNGCAPCPLFTFGLGVNQPNVSMGCPYTNKTCPAGFFCPGRGGMAASMCPIGRYGNITGQTSVMEACPSQCSPGKFGIPGKSSKQEACFSCPGGQFCPGNGSKIACPLGTFGDLPNQSTAMFACTGRCPPGKYGSSAGQTKEEGACLPCTRGTFGNGTGWGFFGRCESQCPSGKFGAGVGKTTEVEACQDCPNGKFQGAQGAQYQSLCTACGAGTYTNENVTKASCTVCPANSYQDETGKSYCKPCAAGKVTFVKVSPLPGDRDSSLKCSSRPMCLFDNHTNLLVVNKSCDMARVLIIGSREVKIVGARANVTISSRGSGRIFQVQAGGRLILENLTLSAEREASCGHNSDAPSCNNGGVLLGSKSSLVATHVTFSHNQHLEGSAVYAHSNTIVNFTNCNFQHNYAGSKGAVLYIGEASSVIVNHCYFEHNRLMYDSSSKPAKGTAIYAEQYTTIKIVQSTFEKHERALSSYTYTTSSYHSGGILYTGPFCNVSVLNSLFKYNRANEGGVAYIGSQSNVSFTRCVFHANGAKNKAGVLYVKSHGIATIHYCNLSLNYVSDSTSYDDDDYTLKGYGGVLALESLTTVVVEDSLFVNNTAGSGGCAYLPSGDVRFTFTRCMFRTNVAKDYGGVVYRGYSSTSVQTVILQNSAFFNNEAGKDGGAVYFQDTRYLRVANCIFQHNEANGKGGAIFTDDIVDLQLTGNSFISNVGRISGGALWGGAEHYNVEDETRVFMSNNTFFGNIALRDGGGVYLGGYESSYSWSSTKQILKIEVDSSSFMNNSAQHCGGGFYSTIAHVNMTSVVFENNNALIDGGGAYVNGLKSIVMIHLNLAKFRSNTVMQKGGGMFLSVAKVGFFSSLFANNRANSEGGGIFLTEGGAYTALIKDCNFVENESPRGFAFSASKVAVVVSQSTFRSNSQFKSAQRLAVEGGAAYVQNLESTRQTDFTEFKQSVQFLRSTFLSNKATYAGGVFLQGPRIVRIDQCVFSGNSATRRGGALYVHGSGEVEVVSSRFTGNAAEIDGGAIAVQDNSKLSFLPGVEGTTFSGNIALANGGALFINEGGSLMMRHRQVVEWDRNNATRGGGIYYASSEKWVNFHISNFPGGNIARANGSNVWVASPSTEPVEIICSATTYFPLYELRRGIPSTVWNLDDPARSVLCPRCPNGKTSEEGSIQCEPCAIGHAGTGGKCLPCPVNWFQDGIGNSACKKCSPGYFTVGTGAFICKAARKPCPPTMPSLQLSDGRGPSQAFDGKDVLITWAMGHSSTTAAGCATAADGFLVEISTHRSFTNGSSDELYRRWVRNAKTRSISLRLSRRLSDRNFLARVQAYNETTQASSAWSLVSEDYTAADSCAAYQYLNVTDLSPVKVSASGATKRVWKCFPCMLGASCKSPTATVVTITPPKKNLFLMTGIRGKFGYWRANTSSIYSFVACPFPPACLGDQNEDLQGQFIDENNIDPAMVDHPDEVCNVQAGYLETCVSVDAPAGSRCRLCTSCSHATRRGYASPRCNSCPSNNILWVVLASVVMMFVFVALLRLGLNSSGRKQQSSHQRRLILSYMQMTALLHSINIQWPAPILVMFDIESAVSTVGDHVLKLDCIVPNIHPGTKVFFMQVFYVLSPFAAVLLIYTFMPCCAGKMKRRIELENVQTRANMTVKGVVLILYLAYPSLVRQAFVLWHCIGIGGRCVSDHDGSVNADLGKYTCDATDGYTYMQDDHKYGDYLYMATGLKCWEGTHAFYAWGVGVPHILLYVFGLPLIAFAVLRRKKNQRRLRHQETLFCYGLLYDGVR